MDFLLRPQEAARLGDRAETVAMQARELALFGESDPELAAQCGVEIGCLEARQLLSGGIAQRIADAARESVQTNRPLKLSEAHLEAISRLEGVVALGSSRIGVKLAAIEAAEKQETLSMLGSVAGVATGVVGFIKSLF